MRIQIETEKIGLQKEFNYRNGKPLKYNNG